MYHHLPLITLSTFTRSKLNRLTLLCLVCFSCVTSFTHAAQQDWILSGTFLSDQNTHAMFVNTTGKELLVDLGDTIQGCKLIDVLHGSAKIRCGDQQHTLILRNSVGDITSKMSYQNSPVKQRIITLSKDELHDYVEQRHRIASAIGFLPVIQDQKVIGFSVSKVRPNSRVSVLGLYNGDIITSINGVPASDTSQFLHTVNEWSSVPQVTIEVDRYGQSHAYTYILE